MPLLYRLLCCNVSPERIVYANETSTFLNARRPRAELDGAGLPRRDHGLLVGNAGSLHGGPGGHSHALRSPALHPLLHEDKIDPAPELERMLWAFDAVVLVPNARPSSLIAPNIER